MDIKIEIKNDGKEKLQSYEARLMIDGKILNDYLFTAYGYDEKEAIENLIIETKTITNALNNFLNNMGE